MRLGGDESQNIDDQRGGGGGGGGFGGGGSGGGIAVGGIGGVILLLIGLFFGVDLSEFTGGGGGGGYAPAPQSRVERPLDPGTAGRAPVPAGAPASEDAGRRFVGQVLRETELVWNQQFQRLGRRYEEPVLVLFSGATRSGCGAAQAQSGPFYCPADKRVYIDLEFMAQLQRRLRAGGDFAAAYIIAHEVGHHVQNLLGVLGQVQRQQRGVSQTEGNALQVRVELQADCLAGVWANNAQRQRNILEDGDVEEGLNAAAAVGDDRITQGRVSPESFTHGSSRQRVTWFRRGLESGDLRACDTFGGQG